MTPDQMHDRILELEAQVQLLTQLLPLVTKTCGRGNCNCVGSFEIKKLVDQHGLAAAIAKSGR